MTVSVIDTEVVGFVVDSSYIFIIPLGDSYAYVGNAVDAANVRGVIIKDTDTSDITEGPVETLSSQGDPHSGDKLDTNKALHCYLENTATSTVKGRVMTYNVPPTDTLDMGAEQTLFTESGGEEIVTFGDISTAVDTTTQAAVAYVTQTGSRDRMYVDLLSISGDTITVDDHQLVYDTDADPGSSIRDVILITHDSGKYIALFRVFGYGGGTDEPIIGKVLTVSGSSFSSVGSAQVVWADTSTPRIYPGGNLYLGDKAACVLSSTKIALIFTEGGYESGYLFGPYGLIASISGDSITEGTPTKLSPNAHTWDGTPVALGPSIAAEDVSTCLFMYSFDDPTEENIINEFTVSGTSISVDDTEEVNLNPGNAINVDYTSVAFNGTRGLGLHIFRAGPNDVPHAELIGNLTGGAAATYTLTHSAGGLPGSII